MADRTAIRDALADLHARGQHSPALAKALGMVPVASPVNLARAGTAVGDLLSGRVEELFRIGEARLAGGSAGLYLALVDEWHARSSDREPYRRKVARALVEHMPLDGRWVCVLLDSQRRFAEAEVILPRRRQGAKSAAGTTRATVNLKDPTHHHLSLLASLDTRGLGNLAALSRRWNDEFSVEVVTTKFHREFRELRDRFVCAVVDANPANPAIAPLLAALPPDTRDSSKRRDAALLKDLNLLAFGTRQLGRLLFLWFLQQKRWLGGAPGNGFDDYLERLFGQHASPTGDGFFNDVLASIFFDALGEPVSNSAHRAAVAKFGTLPFLGGGLFRPDPFEEQLFDIAPDSDHRRQRVAIPDNLFDPSVRDDNSTRTILGFLKGYRFTTQESTPDDQSVDPDPELLGKVFENLYQEDDRHETGAYYTPREIVHYMCRKAIDGYLRTEANVSQETLDRLRARAIDWTPSDDLLDAGTAEALHHALDRVTILDPAVGSGAFLVGTMQEIVLLRRGFEQSQVAHDIDPRSLDVAEWKRRAITRSLHGVDINPMAVEICKLRLWLSLVVDLELEGDGKPINLPDLDFRILAGDSLVDRMGAEPFLQSLPDPRAAGFQPDMAILQQVNGLQNQLEGLKLKFGGEGVTPAGQRDLARRIRRAELEIARVQLDHAKVRAAETVEARRKNPKTTKKALRDAEEHLAGLERLGAGLHEDAPFQKPFLWPVNFHEVLERGGFDIVLANPPYVRMEGIDNIDEAGFAHSFREVAAPRADLLVYFYERAIQLLREGGQLAFITSNSFVKRAYGGPLRNRLGQSLTIETAIDFGEVSVFDASVEPYVLVAQKTKPLPDHKIDGHFLFVELVRRAGSKSSVLRVREQLEELQGLLAADHVSPRQAGFVASGWKLEDDEIVRLFDRLMSEGTPLGKYVQGRMYMGVKTGLNDAFVIDQAKRDELIAADPRSAELIKPWLRGRDIKRWKAEWAGLYVIFTHRGTDIETYPAIKQHLAAFRPALEKRATAAVHPWYELQQPQEGIYEEFEQPKIIWPDIARSLRFAWDESGAFSGNTTYFAPKVPKWLCAILNSDLMEFIVCQLTNSIRGSFVRLFTDSTSLLPIVEPEPAAGAGLEGSVDIRDDIVASAQTAQLYGVTSEEQLLLDDWFAKRSLAAGAGDEADDEE